MKNRTPAGCWITRRIDNESENCKGQWRENRGRTKS